VSPMCPEYGVTYLSGRTALGAAASRRSPPAPRLGSLHSLPLRRVAPFRSRLSGVSFSWQARLLEGRSFDLHDTQHGQPVAIVSRTFAERHWPGTSALGRSVQIIQTSRSPQLTVVGVVSDVKQFTLDGLTTADLYVPLHQMPAFQAPLIASRMFWVVRGRCDAASMIQAVRVALNQVEPNVAASSARTLESLWRASLGSRRANVHMLEAFGNIALVLCATGV
jgi:MacB-like periplasmic core domain